MEESAKFKLHIRRKLKALSNEITNWGSQEFLYIISFDQKPIKNVGNKTELQKERHDKVAGMIQDFINEFGHFKYKPTETTIVFLSRLTYDELNEQLEKIGFNDIAFYLIIPSSDEAIITKHMDVGFSSGFIKSMKDHYKLS